MNKVHFEQTSVPCVDSPEIRWHVDHGWVWDAIDLETRQRIGVFFCTLLCGDGCIVHFSTVPGIEIPWTVTFSAFKKGMRMISSTGLNVIYATIPASKKKLIDTAVVLGFGICDGGYFRPGAGEIVLLKYFGRRLKYIRGRNQRKEQTMSSSGRSVDMPSDPDPTPMASGDPSPEVQGAARAEKKRVARSYGRQKTILAGNTEQQKKTILGG